MVTVVMVTVLLVCILIFPYFYSVMKLFTASQIRDLDQATIISEPIASIDLMERASEALFESFLERYELGSVVCVFAGNGNNGGDALALARLLSQLRGSYEVYIYLFDSEKRSVDWQMNLDRLPDVSIITSENDFPEIEVDDIIIDGIFGTGLKRPVEGLHASLIDLVNRSGAEVFSIDIPSGLFAEDNSNNIGAVIKADVVVSFQFPKLAFLLSDKSDCVGEWEVWDIGLDDDSIRTTLSSYYFLEEEEVAALIKTRAKFSHKGTFGNALLIAGKAGMMGASLLATKACVRSGVGLVTTHLPSLCGFLLQTTVPEALLSIDRSELMFTDELDVEKYSAIGVGPGIGVKHNTQTAFHHLLLNGTKPLVVDADALNILSEHKEWLDLLPQNAILTPHPKEFDRLTKEHASAYERWQTQLIFAQQYEIVVVLKGAHTSIALPDGRCFFNSTGNDGMASGGVGDVLTGIILGLLAQGYSPEEAALVGVYWHGKAADHYAENNLEQTLIASDIIDYMSQVRFL
jgi:hydroxyethylthiazole kinase-like uncharacterized protein yjeF